MIFLRFPVVQLLHFTLNPIADLLCWMGLQRAGIRIGFFMDSVYAWGAGPNADEGLAEYAKRSGKAKELEWANRVMKEYKELTGK